jgi:mono/diheme cytochrome c family protein
MTNTPLRRASLGSAVAFVWVMTVATQSGVSTQTPASPPAQDGARERAVLDQYCVGCHNQRLTSGGLRLDDLDVSRIGDRAEVGEKIVRKLRAGVMPPPDVKRPDRATADFLAGSLEKRLDLAAAAAPTYTPPGPHRLNRREYANAIYDLLNLEVDPGGFLPVDDTSDGFDNIASALNTSPALVEAYVSAAAKISRLALGTETATTQQTYMAASDLSQTQHTDGMSFGTRGGLRVRHYFPVDGIYAFNWTPVRSNAGGMHGDGNGEQLQLSVDGERLKVWNVQAEAPRNASDTRFEVRVPIRAGLRTVELAFIGRDLIPSDDYNNYFDRAFHLPGNVGGWTFAPHVNALLVTGPYDGRRPERTVTRDRIFVCRPATAAQEPACARRILSELASKAFRKPVSATALQGVLAEYEAGRKNGSFEAGIERGLQMILSDPEFIFRLDTPPATARTATSTTRTANTTQSYAVSDLELASRLSFFLWSSIPDDELRTIASQGKLRSPGVLEKQVRRMLADPRAKEFVRNFAGQWLQLRNLQSAIRVDELFPNFDDNLRQAFRTETEMFFESIVQEDRNVVDLLNADYTFLNERLAKYYGIDGVYGSRFRRVTLGPEHDLRRGLLGHGSMLTVTANADRTSPVRRGKWVLINILGVIPPDPPPGVPAFKENTGRGPAPATMRDRMEQHRVSATCASCHKMMDPLGYALEAFDAAGAYRKDDSGHKLDLSGALVDGTRFDGPTQLRTALLAYSPRFVETLTERLMTYALGRGAKYYDMPAVRKIAAGAAARNNRFSALVLGIVESPAFQRNQMAPQQPRLAADNRQ